MNWDDLRFLLAVDKSGTMSGAARALNTNVATVSRRLDRLALDLGAAPFVKTPAGWQASAQTADLLDAARQFEGGLERQRNAAAPRGSAPPRLRLGVAPAVIDLVLLPHLDGAGGVPGPAGRIDLDLVQRTNATGLGTEDVVVQADRPDQGRLSVRLVGSLQIGVYRWRGARRPGWIGLSADYDPFAPQLLAERLLSGPPLLRLDTFAQVFQASRALRLPAPLPRVLARTQPDLVSVGNAGDRIEHDYWLLYHLSRRGDPAVQALSDWIAACFRAVAAPD